MKNKPLKPCTPAERKETIRQAILHMIDGMVLSAKEISSQVAIPEKEVYEHLEHIRRTTGSKKECNLKVYPSVCKKCGFEFIKRDKLKKPGKCPVCKSESISEPLFSVNRK
ncbi:MAG: transcriptional regulator [Nitrospirae bacterium]|jgi:predicted Zn-ribbon and HTH transcriptional regulator|nr:transcriptional regulator [Nitrospirota bacterium]